MFYLKKNIGEYMAVEAPPCFPVIQDINDSRELCFDINYDHPDILHADVPLSNSIAACIGHKVLSIISIPANMIGITVASVGIMGSCLLAAAKISVFILSGQRWNVNTGYRYFSTAGKASFYQLFKTIGENLFEYYFRIISAFDAVVYPTDRNNNVIEWKTLPPVDLLNRTRNSLRQGEGSVKKWILHKFISVINIPANVVSSVISTFGICLGAALVTSKVAIYLFLGLQIQTSTGLEYFFKSFAVANAELLKNIGELGKDSIMLAADIANLLGFHAVMERARDFASHAFRRFYEALN